MNDFFDPITILFAVVAAVIFFRLIGVFGSRTGSESPPPRRPEPPAVPAEGGKVIPMRPATRTETEDAAPTGDSAIDQALADILKADRSFSKAQFVGGARAAYEMIVSAFARGDRKTLQPLLSREVYDGFVEVMDERQRQGQTVSLTFVGIDKADVVEAELINRVARIKMKFVSQLITVTHDRDGKVIDGDPAKVITVTDGWTFERPMSSSDPNWFLVATETLD